MVYFIYTFNSVGKSALLNYFSHHKFQPNYRPTVPTEFYSKDIFIDDIAVTLQIWDTAGDERFRSVSRSFYKGSHGCILVYDITSSESFQALDYWKEDFESTVRAGELDKPSFVLVGNKSDLEEERKVPKEQAMEWCKRNGNIVYLEASALKQTNVVEVFVTIAREAMKEISNSYLSHDQPLPFHLIKKGANKEGDCAC